VIDVLPESEAARKGVKVGDVLVAVDMKASQVSSLHVGAMILLTISRVGLCASI
jgi:S1-C subfamily serine protease